MKPKWKWLPPWDMPADPVQAVFWFLHWFLQVLVRYFWILIVVGVALEAYWNGVVGLLGTLLVGLLVWIGLGVLLAVNNFTRGVSQVFSEVSRIRQNPSIFFESTRDSDRYVPPKEEKIVEGSIITDLDEERKKRRQEI